MDAKIERVQSAPVMQRIGCLFVWLGLAGGCRCDGGGTAAPAPTPYRSDIENLCDAVARSGADQRPDGEHALLIASWLGPHIQTQEAREYLARIQPLVGDAKADALEAEARRVGLTGCALAAEWRAPAGPAPEGRTPEGRTPGSAR